MHQRVDLAAADPETLAAEVAGLLQRGELCALPTETVYGLAMHPSAAGAVARARRWKGRDDGLPFTYHVAGADDLPRLGIADDPRVQRLCARYWPGPLTVVVPARDPAAAGAATVGVRVPAHRFTQDVIRRVGAPLWMTSCNKGGEPPRTDAAAIESEFGREIACIVDDGPSPLGVASTVVRCTGPDLEVLREGILSRDEVLDTAARLCLFVCTGNTCRSPMAEALARKLLAEDLGTAPDALLARGIRFRSAGIATLDGMPASDGGMLAAAEVGCDLSQHSTTELTPQLVHRADRIFCMSRSHLHGLLERVPEAEPKAMLLRLDGRDVTDPYGGDLEDYRRARDVIATALRERLPELRSLLPIPARSG